MKKQLLITEKEAEIIASALHEYKVNKRAKEEKNPNCDKYFLGYECGLIESLRMRVAELFEEEINAKPF